MVLMKLRYKIVNIVCPHETCYYTKITCTFIIHTFHFYKHWIWLPILFVILLWLKLNELKGIFTEFLNPDSSIRSLTLFSDTHWSSTFLIILYLIFVIIAITVLFQYFLFPTTWWYFYPLLNCWHWRRSKVHCSLCHRTIWHQITS